MNARSMAVTLVRREFWEHRSLWLAPAIAAAAMLILSIFGALVAGSHMRMDGPPGGIHFGPGPDPGSVPGAVRMLGFVAPVFIVGAIASFTYLLDCLFAERKDRSILFWKSLPVSDLQTVLAKFAVGGVIAPLGVFVLAVAAYAIIVPVFLLSLPRFAPLGVGVGLAEVPGAIGHLLAASLATILWYAPLCAWLMLSSVLSRRSAWLFTILVPVGLVLAEGVLLRTNYVQGFIVRRLGPVVDAAEALTRPGLWLGLVAAAGMLYIVIRLRRYRDDT